MCNEYLGLTRNFAKKKTGRKEKESKAKESKEERDGDSSQASI